jgi:hypothetical protein
VTRRSWIQVGVGLALLAGLIVAVDLVLERAFAPAATVTSPTAAPAPGNVAVAHITTTLFYATPDGAGLAGVQREVPLAPGAAAQGRIILDALMEPAPDGYVSVIPSGTTVRGFYVTDRQDAFVDFSARLVAGHPGGSTTELLTVNAIVNAVTANLPSVQRVQILIEGKEVDTLAGHVDLRRPLERDTSLIRDTAAEPAR